MTSKASSSSSRKEFRKVYLWTLKSNKGLAILYTVLCFIALPVVFYLFVSSLEKPLLESDISSLNSTFKMLICAVIAPIMILFSLIFSLNAFSYMHKKRKVDLFHALPIKRTPLFLGKYCAILSMLIVPLVFNFGIGLLISPLSGLVIFDLKTILWQMGWILFFTISITAFCAFFAICCGTTLDAIVSVGAISILYPLTIILGTATVAQILPGFSFNGSLEPTYMTALSPFTAVFVPLIGMVDNSYWLWWMFFTAVLLAGCILLYRRRKSESAESSFSFPIPVLIRFIGSFAAGIGVGMVFFNAFNNSSYNESNNYIQTNNNWYFWIGALIGSLLVHIILEVIYSRGFKKLKRSLLYYAAFAVIFVGAYFIVATGCFGYDTYIPSADTVKSVSVGPVFFLDENSSYHENGYTITNNNNANNLSNTSYGNSFPTLKESESIKDVIELHKMLIEDYKKTALYPYQITQMHSSDYYGSVIINYSLKDGRTISRKYNITYNEKSSTTMSKIPALDEFKKAGQLLFSLSEEDVDTISFFNANPRGGGQVNAIKSLYGLSDNIKRELLDALQKDVLAETAEQESSYQYNSTGLFLMLQPYNSNEIVNGTSKTNHFVEQTYCIPEHYTNTRAVIDKYGWLK